MQYLRYSPILFFFKVPIFGGLPRKGGLQFCQFFFKLYYPLIPRITSENLMKFRLQLFLQTSLKICLKIDDSFFYTLFCKIFEIKIYLFYWFFETNLEKNMLYLKSKKKVRRKKEKRKERKKEKKQKNKTKRGKCKAILPSLARQSVNLKNWGNSGGSRCEKKWKTGSDLKNSNGFWILHHKNPVMAFY